MRTAFIHVPHATRVICFWGCAHRLKRRPWGKVVVSGPSDELRTARAFEILLFCVLRFICRVPFKASGHAANLQRARRKQAWPIVIWCLDAWKDSGEMMRAGPEWAASGPWATASSYLPWRTSRSSGHEGRFSWMWTVMSPLSTWRFKDPREQNVSPLNVWPGWDAADVGHSL